MKLQPITRGRLRLAAIATVVLTILLIIMALFQVRPVTAFQVTELPPGNLIQNPWFRSAADPSASALDGWTDAAGLDKYWSSSQKESNPSPDIVIAGTCGHQPVYCGTSARLSDTPGMSGGIGVPGVDTYLYQVVQADPSHTRLKFFMHWVSHLIEPAEMQIFGGNSPNGPWTLVWTPFYHEQDEVIFPPPGGSIEDIWEVTGMLEHTISDGFPYYKVQMHGRLPIAPERKGFKFTGVYFSTEPGTPGPTPTPSPSPTPGPNPTPVPTQPPPPPPPPFQGRIEHYIPIVQKQW